MVDPQLSYNRFSMDGAIGLLNHIIPNNDNGVHHPIDINWEVLKNIRWVQPCY